jgi:hypothetical protein
MFSVIEADQNYINLLKSNNHFAIVGQNCMLSQSFVLLDLSFELSIQRLKIHFISWKMGLSI